MGTLSGISKVNRARLRQLSKLPHGTISVSEAATVWKVSSSEAARLLSRLAGHGWLNRIKRGIYIAIPLESNSPNLQPEDPWIVANSLFSPCYVGGWSACEHWELTEQVFRSILVYTTRNIKNRTPSHGGLDFVLRKITPPSLFGLTVVWRGRVRVQVSDLNRTVLDLLDSPDAGGGIRHVSEIFQVYLKTPQRDLDRLVIYAEQLGNGAAIKRLGFFLELYSPEQKQQIERCRKLLTAGNSYLDPKLEKDHLITRWKLWVPESFKKELDGR